MSKTGVHSQVKKMVWKARVEVHQELLKSPREFAIFATGQADMSHFDVFKVTVCRLANVHAIEVHRLDLARTIQAIDDHKRAVWIFIRCWSLLIATKEMH